MATDSPTGPTGPTGTAVTDSYSSNWGPSYWRFIHYFSVGSSISRDLLADTVNHIPCDACKSEWVSPDPRVNLLEWSVALHNKVNTKLNKYDKWTTTDFGISHDLTCDICNPTSNTVFPWPFIHTVAKVNHPDALNFLKTFNSVYPCLMCRGRFFADSPLANESVLDWTIRNHLIKDPLFIYPVITTTCATCPGGVLPTSIGPTGPDPVLGAQGTYPS